MEDLFFAKSLILFGLGGCRKEICFGLGAREHALSVYANAGLVTFTCVAVSTLKHRIIVLEVDFGFFYSFLYN